MSVVILLFLGVDPEPVVAETPAGYPISFGFGTALPDNGRLVRLTAIPPDGEGLPEGQGSYAAGADLYRQTCAACHGPGLEGTATGPALIGGRGSLASREPRATVESYWPYAPPVFSYIRNTMPTTAPGSLRDDEVYSLMAYILASAGIIPEDMLIDRETLPQISMPNRDGFIPDPRPDVSTTTD